MIPMTIRQIAGALGTDVPPGLRDVQALRITTDSRDVRPGDLFFALRGDRFDGHRFAGSTLQSGAVACVCARDARGQMPATTIEQCVWVQDTTAALGRLAAYYRRSVLPVSSIVIAITGSNGKTTTKRLVDHVLSGALKGSCSPKSFNNQVGVPLTLFSADADDKYVVVEIGTNAPGEVAQLAAIASPHVAVITSIGEAHIGGFGDIGAIAKEKASLLDHLRPNGLAVVNIDRREILPHLDREIRGRLITIGSDARAKLHTRDREGTIYGSRFVLDDRFEIELPMPGTHHATNAMAAFAVCRWFGLDPRVIIDRLATFEPPEGRTRCIDLGDVTIIDDTYNANPASMLAAIDTLCCQKQGRRIFVMGDMLELGEETARLHHAVVRAAMDAGIEVLVAVGQETTLAVGELTRATDAIQVIACNDADTAGDILEEIVFPGDTVLLKGSRLIALDKAARRLAERARSRLAVA